MGRHANCRLSDDELSDGLAGSHHAGSGIGAFAPVWALLSLVDMNTSGRNKSLGSMGLAMLLAAVIGACSEDMEESCARMLASGSYDQVCSSYRMDGGANAQQTSMKCSMKFGTCKSADDCTCGASCGVTSVCSTCTKRCVFYCQTDADCVKRTSHLLTPLLRCNQTSSSGIKVCQ